jgi:hypothetical protein
MCLANYGLLPLWWCKTRSVYLAGKCVTTVSGQVTLSRHEAQLLFHCNSCAGSNIVLLSHTCRLPSPLPNQTVRRTFYRFTHSNSHTNCSRMYAAQGKRVIRVPPAKDEPLETPAWTISQRHGAREHRRADRSSGVEGAGRQCGSDLGYPHSSTGRLAQKWPLAHSFSMTGPWDSNQIPSCWFGTTQFHRRSTLTASPFPGQAVDSGIV